MKVWKLIEMLERLPKDLDVTAYAHGHDIFSPLQEVTLYSNLPRAKHEPQQESVVLI